MSLQIGAVEAAPGMTVVTSKGAVQLSVGAASASSVTLTAEAMGPVPVNYAVPAVASWGPGRLDIFGIGLDGAMYHKAWDDNGWYPSQNDWRPHGSMFSSPRAGDAWGPERLDMFDVGRDCGVGHM